MSPNANLVLNAAAERRIREGAIEWCHLALDAPVPPISGSYNFLIWRLVQAECPRHLVIGDFDEQTADRARSSEVPIVLVKRIENPLARSLRAVMVRAHAANEQARFEWARRPQLTAIMHVLRSARVRRLLVWGDLRLLPALRHAFPRTLIGFSQRHYDFPDRAVPYNHCDIVVFQTPGQVKRASDRLFHFNPLVIVIPNGVDTKQFSPAGPTERRAARRRLGVPEDSFVINFPSALTAAKGVYYLLRWMAFFQSEPRIHFLVPNRVHDYCEARLRDELQATLPSAKNVTWLDGLPNAKMPVVFHASDLTILPQTRREGFAHSCLESMSCGVPPAVVAEGGPGEYVVHGQTGIHLPLDDVLRTGIATIRDLQKNREEQERLGRAARDYVVRELTLKKQLDNYQCFFSGEYENINPSLGKRRFRNDDYPFSTKTKEG